MEIYILDKIENGIASIENSDGAMLYVSANRLPENSKSGDCFTFEKGQFYFSPSETESRRKNVKSLLDSLIDKK